MQNLERRSTSLSAPATPEAGADNWQLKTFQEGLESEGRSKLPELIERHHYRTFWTYGANVLLAIWLITSPFVFDYQSKGLACSDIICGALIIAFEFISFVPKFTALRLATAATGFWLLLAPLIFWSPTPAVYLLDTLIGSLVLTFSVPIPGPPWQAGSSLPGPDMPPGWTYNPSSWIRRWLGIGLGLFGFLVSRSLAAHQLGYLGHAWDPFFGDGTDRVLHSDVSKSFPISDAGFGGVAYLMEVLTGFMGDRARWRTAPWIVVAFALLVLPLGATSIILVITQPIVVGAWCGPCLVAAAALLVSVPLAVHEAIAVGQFLVLAKKQGKDLWNVFWFGGTVEGGGAADPDRFRFNLAQRWIASVQGVTVPLTLVASIAIGIWLMACPDILSYTGKSANCDHLLGALAVTFAMIATAEVTRVLRVANILVGLTLLVVAGLISHDLTSIFWSELISGLSLILLSKPRGEIIERYADWDRFVK